MSSTEIISSNFNKYTHRYCKRANCIFYENSSCSKNLSPTDNQKAKKLHKSTGYCDLYQTMYEAKFRANAFGIMSTEVGKFTRKLKKEIDKLKQIPIIKFNHNITSSHFNPEALMIFLSLEINLEKNYEPTPNSPLEEAKKKLSHLKKRYQYLKEDLTQIINRGFGKKPYKKVGKQFRRKYSAVRQDNIDFIRYVKKYRRKLQLRNKLLDDLFTGLKKKVEIDIDNLTQHDYFYFRDYYDKKIEYLIRNTGKIKGEEEWKDYCLAPSRNLYYEDEPHQSYISLLFDEVEEIPIFRMLRKKKLWIEIQNIYTLDLVKIYFSYSYKIFSIHFPAKINPDSPKTPSRIDYFFKSNKEV